MGNDRKEGGCRVIVKTAEAGLDGSPGYFYGGEQERLTASFRSFELFCGGIQCTEVEE